MERKGKELLYQRLVASLLLYGGQFPDFFFSLSTSLAFGMTHRVKRWERERKEKELLSTSFFPLIIVPTPKVNEKEFIWGLIIREERRERKELYWLSLIY